MEVLGDRSLWLKSDMFLTDDFASRLLRTHVKWQQLQEWITNPVFKNSHVRLFEHLRGKDSSQCLSWLLENWSD